MNDYFMYVCFFTVLASYVAVFCCCLRAAMTLDQIQEILTASPTARHATETPTPSAPVQNDVNPLVPRVHRRFSPSISINSRAINHDPTLTDTCLNNLAQPSSQFAPSAPSLPATQHDESPPDYGPPPPYDPPPTYESVQRTTP